MAQRASDFSLASDKVDSSSGAERTEEIIEAITLTSARQCLTQFNTDTATGTDGLAVSDVQDAPDEALLAEDGRSSPTSVGRVRKRAQIGAQLARCWERGVAPSEGA